MDTSNARTPLTRSAAVPEGSAGASAGYFSGVDSMPLGRNSLRQAAQAQGSKIVPKRILDFPTELSLRFTEKEVIKDLIYIFQGFDGKIIKWDSSLDKYLITTNTPLHPSVKTHALKLAELGTLFKKIRNYCDKPTTGLTIQSLKYAFDQECQEFYRLLALVQKEEVQKKSIEAAGILRENIQQTAGDMTMLKLSVWMFDLFPRFQLLSAMIDACEEKKGGEICSVLYLYTQHGDPMVSKLSTCILALVAKPTYLTLCQWILYGELRDPHNEFFISSEPNCDEVWMRSKMWHEKYKIREKMLPSFIKMQTAEKILATGKNINFLKEILRHKTSGYEGRLEIKNLLERSPVECLFLEEDLLLNKSIEKAYKTTSAMVLHDLIENSRLLDHFKCIKRFLLLGQGNFIHLLMKLLHDELSKPATKLLYNKISNILESAISATNTQYETEKNNAHNRLSIRFLDCNDKDLGWESFCLDYQVRGPVQTVLTDYAMTQYNQLFNSLWRTKRIEMILSTLWKNQTALFKCQRLIPEIGPVLHISQLLISQMLQFVCQMQYYIMFEATECAWNKLMQDITKSSDLDQLIKSHNKFLVTITNRSLLNPLSRDLLNQLRGIFNTVHELKTFLTQFEDRVSEEMQDCSEKRPSQKEFFPTYILRARGRIETLHSTTQDLVCHFLMAMNHQSDLSLRSLSYRLDFNEYYCKIDYLLRLPSAFRHSRQSGIHLPVICDSISSLSNNFASMTVINGTPEMKKTTK